MSNFSGNNRGRGRVNSHTRYATSSFMGTIVCTSPNDLLRVPQPFPHGTAILCIGFNPFDFLHILLTYKKFGYLENLISKMNQIDYQLLLKIIMYCTIYCNDSHIAISFVSKIDDWTPVQEEQYFCDALQKLCVLHNFHTFMAFEKYLTSQIVNVCFKEFCKKGIYNRMKYLHVNGYISFDTIDAITCEYLNTCIEFGHRNMAEYIVSEYNSNKVSIIVTFYAFHNALVNKYDDVLDFILSKKEITFDAHIELLFIDACMYGASITILDKILSRNIVACLSYQCQKTAMSALMVAAKHGWLHIVVYITSLCIIHKIDIDIRCKQNRNAFAWCLSAYAEVTQNKPNGKQQHLCAMHLFQYCDVNFIDNDGNNALSLIDRKEKLGHILLKMIEEKK